MLRPAIRSLAPSIAYTQDDRAKDKRIAPPASWKRWYKTARWRALREVTFLRDLYTCKMCGLVHISKATLSADHVRAHRGDPGLFWDTGNIQTLCTSPCHNKHKQALEQQELRSGLSAPPL